MSSNSGNSSLLMKSHVTGKLQNKSHHKSNKERRPHPVETGLVGA